MSNLSDNDAKALAEEMFSRMTGKQEARARHEAQLRNMARLRALRLQRELRRRKPEAAKMPAADSFGGHRPISHAAVAPVRRSTR